MEMHSTRSLYEIHGICARPRRRSLRGRIARRAITRLLAVLKGIKAAIEAELAAREAIAELASMNDYMLRDLGITRDSPSLSSKISRSPKMTPPPPDRSIAWRADRRRDPHRLTNTLDLNEMSSGAEATATSRPSAV